PEPVGGEPQLLVAARVDHTGAECLANGVKHTAQIATRIRLVRFRPEEPDQRIPPVKGPGAWAGDSQVYENRNALGLREEVSQIGPIVAMQIRRTKESQLDHGAGSDRD